MNNNIQAIEKDPKVIPAKELSLSEMHIFVFFDDRWDLHKEFKKFNPVFDGAGWYIDLKYNNEIEKICSEKRLLKTETPLPKKFAYRHEINISRFRQKMDVILEDIKVITERKSINWQNVEDLIGNDQVSKKITDPKVKEALYNLIDIYKKFDKKIQWENDHFYQYKDSFSSHGQSSSSSSFSLQFLSEKSKNWLVDEAPEAPMLFYSLDEKGQSDCFIRRGIVGSIVGAGATGKTHLLAQLALSVATGTSFLNKFFTKKPGYVFIAFGENGEDDIHRLLRKTFKNLYTDQNPQEAIKRLAIESVSGKNAAFMCNSSPTPFFNELLQELKIKEPEEGWALIILDPISRFLGPEAERDNAEATAFISLLEKMILELKGKPTIIFGHHMSKSGFNKEDTNQSDSRGSSAITDGVRWQSNFDKFKNDESRRKFKVVKTNFTKYSPALILKQDNFGCFIFERDESEIEKQITESTSISEKNRTPLKDFPSMQKSSNGGNKINAVLSKALTQPY